MGRVDGKVAFITGAARGQGRAHAIRLAEEGADIIAIDVCEQVDTVTYPMATADDLAETVTQVEALDRRIIASQVDVRDAAGLKKAVNDGVAELGRLDIVVANAGIASVGIWDQLTDQSWQDVIDINLTGVWNTLTASIPHLKANQGGSIIITSSFAGIRGLATTSHYTAAKHGVVGLMRTLANELGPDNIRVNTVNPGTVSTPMIHNDMTYESFTADVPLAERTDELIRERFATMNVMPTPWVEVEDIANAVLFLASDESRFITGVRLPIDAGAANK